jgi:hypothetical protein
VKLFIACVAALSLFGCADEPGTSGDNEISVVGTKTSQTREGTLLDNLSKDIHFRIEDVRFSERLGHWVESFFPDNVDEDACVNCELVFAHQSDGRIDTTEIWTVDGNYLCRVQQTAITVLQNTCQKFQKL